MSSLTLGSAQLGTNMQEVVLQRRHQLGGLPHCDELRSISTAAAGDDTLFGGTGNDFLYGGAGTNTFKFASRLGQRHHHGLDRGDQRP